jgi:hypothetical protein
MREQRFCLLKKRLQFLNHQGRCRFALPCVNSTALCLLLLKPRGLEGNRDPLLPSSLYWESSIESLVLQVDLWQEIKVSNGVFNYSALSPAAITGLSAAPAAGEDAIASYGIFSGSQVVNQLSVR